MHYSFIHSRKFSFNTKSNNCTTNRSLKIKPTLCLLRSFSQQSFGLPSLEVCVSFPEICTEIQPFLFLYLFKGIKSGSFRIISLARCLDIFLQSEQIYIKNPMGLHMLVPWSGATVARGCLQPRRGESERPRVFPSHPDSARCCVLRPPWRLVRLSETRGRCGELRRGEAGSVTTPRGVLSGTRPRKTLSASASAPCAALSVSWRRVPSSTQGGSPQ